MPNLVNNSQANIVRTILGLVISTLHSVAQQNSLIDGQHKEVNCEPGTLFKDESFRYRCYKEGNEIGYRPIACIDGDGKDVQPGNPFTDKHFKYSCYAKDARTVASDILACLSPSGTTIEVGSRLSENGKTFACIRRENGDVTRSELKVTTSSLTTMTSSGKQNENVVANTAGAAAFENCKGKQQTFADANFRYECFRDGTGYFPSGCISNGLDVKIGGTFEDKNFLYTCVQNKEDKTVSAEIYACKTEIGNLEVGYNGPRVTTNQANGKQFVCDRKVNGDVTNLRRRVRTQKLEFSQTASLLTSLTVYTTTTTATVSTSDHDEKSRIASEALEKLRIQTENERHRLESETARAQADAEKARAERARAIAEAEKAKADAAAERAKAQAEAEKTRRAQARAAKIQAETFRLAAEADAAKARAEAEKAKAETDEKAAGEAQRGVVINQSWNEQGGSGNSGSAGGENSGRIVSQTWSSSINGGGGGGRFMKQSWSSGGGTSSGSFAHDDASNAMISQQSFSSGRVSQNCVDRHSMCGTYAKFCSAPMNSVGSSGIVGQSWNSGISSHSFQGGPSMIGGGIGGIIVQKSFDSNSNSVPRKKSRAEGKKECFGEKRSFFGGLKGLFHKAVHKVKGFLGLHHDEEHNEETELAPQSPLPQGGGFGTVSVHILHHNPPAIQPPPFPFLVPQSPPLPFAGGPPPVGQCDFIPSELMSLMCPKTCNTCSTPPPPNAAELEDSPIKHRCFAVSLHVNWVCEKNTAWGDFYAYVDATSVEDCRTKCAMDPRCNALTFDRIARFPGNTNCAFYEAAFKRFSDFNSESCMRKATSYE